VYEDVETLEVLDLDVNIEVPPEQCFAKGEAMALQATITDGEGNLLPGNSVTWASLNEDVASIEADGTLRAKGGGTVNIQASARQCEDYKDEIPLEVLDLEGEWAGTETANETGCGEGVNVYHREVVVTHIGDIVTFTIRNGRGSGTKNGCSIEGVGWESEDLGVSTGKGGFEIAPDGSSMKGGVSWGWSDGTYSCSGSSTFSVKR
jgi:hypothetical protein